MVGAARTALLRTSSVRQWLARNTSTEIAILGRLALS
jgi:hypothetical protein